MPFNPVFSIDDEHSNDVFGSQTAAVAAGAATTVIKNNPGRLVSVLVTAAGTAATTFYDNNAGSGLVIGALPAATTVGQIFNFQMPAANAITAVGVVGSAALTVCYS